MAIKYMALGIKRNRQFFLKEEGFGTVVNCQNVQLLCEQVMFSI